MQEKEGKTISKMAEETEAETGAYFSNLDFFILSLMAGMAVYWYFFKNKQKEQPTFKKLTVAWVKFLLLKPVKKS